MTRNRLARRTTWVLVVLVSLGCESPRAASPVTPPEKADFRLAHRLVPGEHRQYELEYRSVSFADFRPLLGQPIATGAAAPDVLGMVSRHETEVRGRWEKAVLDDGPDAFLIAWRLADAAVRLQINGRPAAAPSEAIAAGLNRWSFARIDGYGKVETVWFSDSVDELPQNYARELLAMTQFVLPEQGDTPPRVWHTGERGPNGLYEARYEFDRPRPDANHRSGQSGTEAARIRKTIVRYVRLHALVRFNPLERPTIIEPGGSLSAEFDMRQGRLRSLGGTFSQDIRSSGEKIARADNTLRLQWVRQGTLGRAEVESLRAAARRLEHRVHDLSTNPFEHEEEARLQRRELGDATLEDLLDDLDKLDRGDHTIDASRLYLKLKALVYLEPAKSGRLGELLHTAEATSQKVRLPMGVLAAVGHAEAQAALIAALDTRRGDRSIVSQLVAALGDVSEPTRANEDVLRRLAFDQPDERLAATAQLALGNQARHLATSAPDRAGGIVRRLLDELAPSRSESAQRRLLLALGNAASPDALPAVLAKVTDASYRTRAAAVFALRWIDSPEAERQIRAVLATDPDELVRLHALEALQFRRPNDRIDQALRTAASSDPSERVRAAALSQLAND